MTNHEAQRRTFVNMFRDWFIEMHPLWLFAAMWFVLMVLTFLRRLIEASGYIYIDVLAFFIAWCFYPLILLMAGRNRALRVAAIIIWLAILCSFVWLVVGEFEESLLSVFRRAFFLGMLLLMLLASYVISQGGSRGDRLKFGRFLLNIFLFWFQPFFGIYVLHSKVRQLCSYELDGHDQRP